MNPWLVLVVIIGGAIGSVARFWLSRKWPAKPGRVPKGILLANLIGSGLAGVIAGIAMLSFIAPDEPAAYIAGFCGGLTTFSTWAVDVVLTAQEGDRKAAFKNIAWTAGGSVITFGVTLALTLWIAVAAFASTLG